MINGISGRPGGGKSYEAVVTHIIKTVTVDKRKVVTNLPLNIEHFCTVYGEYCRDLIEVIDGQFHNYGGQRPFSKKEHYLQYEDWQNDKGQKVYFFIDECHLPMPVGGTDKALEEFYSLHRHYGFDIMLITQNFRKASKDIRDMVQNHYRCIKKSMLGQDDRYILKVHDGSSSTKQSVVATHERQYEKKYYKFYQSHTKSNVSVEESASNDIKKWYSHWTIKASVVFFVFGFWMIGKQLTKDDKEKETVVTEAVNEAVQSPVVVGATQQLGVNNLEEPKTVRQMEYEEMVQRSKSFHPYHKVNLSISGYAEFMDDGRRTKVHWLSANQNGQHVFTLKSSDLMLAGYDVRVLTECSIRIRFYDYEDYLTCDAPRQSVTLAGDQLASNN